MIKPDATLEETVAEAIAQRLTTGKVVVLKRHALAKHAARDAFRQGLAAAGQVVAEMAADHERCGETAVASRISRPAPDRASCPRWIKCQSLGSPPSAEYWHIGAITMRLTSSNSPTRKGVNSFARVIDFPLDDS